jgi:hypothetical protein
VLPRTASSSRTSHRQLSTDRRRSCTRDLETASRRFSLTANGARNAPRIVEILKEELRTCVRGAAESADVALDLQVASEVVLVDRPGAWTTTRKRSCGFTALAQKRRAELGSARSQQHSTKRTLRREKH